MKNVLVLYGGVSCEHDISVITGVQAMMHLDRLKYRVVPVYLHTDGKWYSGEPLRKIAYYKRFLPEDRGIEEVCLLNGSSVLYRYRRGKLKSICDADCAVLCNHGLNGEDGSLQGVLQLHGIPYTSCGVFGSALGMDKVFGKMFFASQGIRQVAYAVCKKEEFSDDPFAAAARLTAALGLPIIVKPANLGSSIGIGLAHSEDELVKALDVGFRYDLKVVAEKALTDFVEVNCAAVRYRENVLVSELEQPLVWQDFLTFADKYEGRKSGKSGVQGCAELSEEVVRQVRDTTRRVYELLDLSGVVRADFMVQGDEVYFNELNTIPGSLAYYLWEKRGISFEKLLDIMIEEAVARKREREKLTYVYRSEVLAGSGTKVRK